MHWDLVELLNVNGQKWHWVLAAYRVFMSFWNYQPDPSQQTHRPCMMVAHYLKNKYLSNILTSFKGSREEDLYNCAVIFLWHTITFRHSICLIWSTSIFPTHVIQLDIFWRNAHAPPGGDAVGPPLESDTLGLQGPFPNHCAAAGSWPPRELSRLQTSDDGYCRCPQGKTETAPGRKMSSGRLYWIFSVIL